MNHDRSCCTTADSILPQPVLQSRLSACCHVPLWMTAAWPLVCPTPMAGTLPLYFFHTLIRLNMGACFSISGPESRQKTSVSYELGVGRLNCEHIGMG